MPQDTYQEFLQKLTTDDHQWFFEHTSFGFDALRSSAQCPLEIVYGSTPDGIMRLGSALAMKIMDAADGWVTSPTYRAQIRRDLLTCCQLNEEPNP